MRLGHAAETAGRRDHDPGVDQGPDHRERELHHVGVDDTAQAAGGRVGRREDQDQENRDQVVGGRHLGREAGDALAELQSRGHDERHDGLVDRRRQPLVPGQEHLGDANGRDQHHGHHDAVDHRAVVDRLEHPQRQHAAPAVAHFRELGVGQHAAAAPADREHERHQQEGERVDPQAPERKDAGGRDQAGDQKRRVGGELGRRHRQAGLPAGNGLAGEKILLKVLRCLVACAQTGADGVDDEGKDDEQVDHGANQPPLPGLLILGAQPQVPPEPGSSQPPPAPRSGLCRFWRHRPAQTRPPGRSGGREARQGPARSARRPGASRCLRHGTAPTCLRA